jgi:threonyl-tRNA synthetase
MIQLKLPDGLVKEFPEGSSPRAVAESIGKRLADAAIAGVANGAIVDLDRPIENGAAGVIEFRLLTARDREALDVLRHSTAHVMARAIMRLFPGVKLAFGPTTGTGFYYDIEIPGRSLSEDDFPAIEAEIAKIVALAEPFDRFTLPVAEARQFCAELGQTLKVEHIDEELHKYGVLSFYRQGEFVDLCRGPHIPHAGKVGAVKLLSIAGAYWKGRTEGPMLQRVYGTAFFDKKDLDAYLRQVEEAKKRDHRRLGKELGLFTISPLVGSGLILWMPKGALVRGVLEQFLKEELLKRGYQPVYTPHIGKVELYKTSGHYPYYSDSQYPPIHAHPFAPQIQYMVDLFEAVQLDRAHTSELAKSNEPHLLDEAIAAEKFTQTRLRIADEKFVEAAKRYTDFPLNKYIELSDKYSHKHEFLEAWLDSQDRYLLKPMNCPHHIQIFAAQPRSYRDLPLRLAEFGTVYRYEKPGELSGLTRARGFTQDDAHLFCTPEQVRAEFRATMELTQFVLSRLGLSDYRLQLSKSDPDDPKYQGKEGENLQSVWERAEEDIRAVLVEMGLPYKEKPGDAAFYGPKADFFVRDCMAREWQLGTEQLDYLLPERFALHYVGADNQPHRPVMIHRAPFGSMERFMGILIEHFAGAFPLWLAPEQVRVLPISEKVSDYADTVLAQLQAAGLRASLDARPEKIGAKIRDAQLEKIPVMLVVGQKEAETGQVSYRDRVDGDLGAMPFEAALERIARESSERVIRGVVQTGALAHDEGQTEQHAY